MKHNRALLAGLVAVLFIATSALRSGKSIQDKYAETITAGDLRNHLSVLASDEYEGRETGERGQKKAGEYIAEFFKSCGIPPQADASWYQSVKLVKISGGESAISSGNKSGAEKSFVALTDYYYTYYAQPIKTKASEIIFAGYGIDDKKYSDYEPGLARDKKYYDGKVVMILDGEPKNNGVFTIGGERKPGMWTTQRRAKLNAAKDNGVKVLLIVPENFENSKEGAKHGIEGYSLSLDEPQGEAEKQPVVIYISAAMANELLSQGGEKRKIEELRAAINNSGKPEQLVASTSMSIEITRKEEKLTTENVLGFVEGSDLKNEIIVVTAHYDHLGIHDGKIFNGADDDGSGTVAVMELAEAFAKAKQEGNGPRRSMLFMAVSGEEKGLLGSSWYTKHPVYPLEQTMCDLNIDMIGRVDEIHAKDSNFIYVIGSDKISSDLKKITETANKKHTRLKLDYRYDDEKDPNMFYYRSDHYNFAKNGIPVAFFFNGTHEDYHKETDEISKINFRLMAVRTKLVFYTAWDLANRPKAIRRDKAPKK